jgi:hypothetical protein
MGAARFFLDRGGESENSRINLTFKTFKISFTDNPTEFKIKL